MKFAIYHAPGAESKSYECKSGEKPGTVDLFNEKGRAIVIGVPVVGKGDEKSAGGCAVLVSESKPKPSAKKSTPKAPVLESVVIEDAGDLAD